MPAVILGDLSYNPVKNQTDNCPEIICQIGLAECSDQASARSFEANVPISSAAGKQNAINHEIRIEENKFSQTVAKSEQKGKCDSVEQSNVAKK